MALVLAHITLCPLQISRLSSHDKSIPLCVQEQQDVSWKQSWENWPHGAKVKKPNDTSTQLSDKLTEKNQENHIQGKCSCPYIPFFLNLDKYEGLWGQDTAESDSEVVLNVCLRVWQQVCLRNTLISLRCLDWTFEFSEQCFAAAQVLTLFAGENKCGSSPSKEAFKALHGHNFNSVQDVW